MDKDTKKICALLENPDNVRRCGAACVLAELAPKDPAVTKALGNALESANAMLTGYILEALDAIGSRAAVPYVLPLLGAEDLATRMRAAAIVSKAGETVVPDIKKQLVAARGQGRIILVDLLARIHARAAFEVILDLLFDPDFEMVKQTCEAVRRHIQTATPKQRGALHKLVAAFMSKPQARKRERVFISCLLLIGSIGRPEARTILLKHASPKESPYVRKYSLIALSNMAHTKAAAASVIRQMLALLGDKDPDVVRRALDVLRPLPVTETGDASWKKLLKSPHPSVRSFAIRKIADADTVANSRFLIGLLTHEDTDVSETAASALSHSRRATTPLLEALAASKDADISWRLVRILKPHSASVDKKTAARFVTLAAHDLQAQNRRYEALIYFLRNIDPQLGDSVLLESGQKFRRAKRWAQAVDCLRKLTHSPVYDADAQYALSICNLKLSPKELSPSLRAEDHALRGFLALARNKGFKLKNRIVKEPGLDSTDLYYIAFHFSDMTEEQKTLGEELLAHIIKKWPRSKDANAARTKLKVARPKRAGVPRKKTGAKKAAKKTRKRAAEK